MVAPFIIVENRSNTIWYESFKIHSNIHLQRILFLFNVHLFSSTSSLISDINKVKNARQEQSHFEGVEVPSEPQATSLEDLPGYRNNEEFYKSPKSKASNTEKIPESEVSPKVCVSLKIVP